MDGWKMSLELAKDLTVTAGSQAALQAAIRNGADLRIYTEFRHHEHLEPGSDNHELVQEVSDFRVTYLLEDRWVAGIMNLRMPISPPDGFGPRPSMSFFLYNQDGRQAIARPYLDGVPVTASPGASPLDDHSDMPKYHQLDAWDSGTNAPSSNFIYDFEVFRYFVRDGWRQVFAHEVDGTVVDGSLDALISAFSEGAEIKVALRGLCEDLGSAMDHEVFVHTGPGYYSTERKLFCAGTQPVVRVTPAVPLRYQTRGWDFGWLMVRTDGLVARWLCDPYTLEFRESQAHHAIRWFVR
ncbi:MAG: hypothetical protein HY318_19025 [Armatimonadetes bacterium]|nr:hypothetical protein [Armatimonadota bacterium]